MKKKGIILLLILGSINLSLAQTVKFGKVSKADLQVTEYAADPEADAVVLYKEHNSYYGYNQDIGWVVNTEVHERIQIFNENGFDYAQRKIRIYNGKENEDLKIKGYTYNLENGKINKAKLEKNQIYEEEINRYWKSRNFSMPAVKAGSIVEWKYTLSSPYATSLEVVNCQYMIPIAHLKGVIQVPEFWVFNVHQSPYYNIPLRTSKELKTFTLSERTERNGGGFGPEESKSTNYDVDVEHKTYSFEQKNVPALTKEPYMSSYENYRAKLEFELSMYQPRNGLPKYYSTSWDNIAKDIYNDLKFGEELKKSGYFKDDLQNVLAKTSNQNEQTVAIFEFVKNKVIWNNHQSIYAYDGVRRAYREGEGNSAEINLILVAMLREAGLKANPVLISTRKNGIPLFPTRNGFNSVIAAVENGQGTILMDATDRYSTPNSLPEKDLNWQGYLMRSDGSHKVVDLYPNHYSETEVKLSVKLDEQGGINGMMISTLKGLKAQKYRQELGSLTEEERITYVASNNNDLEVEQYKVRNKDNPYQPITELIKFSNENQVDVIGNKMYISPMLFLTINESPFKLENRNFPIDYASPWKNKTNVSITLPEGYTTTSIPEELALSLPDGLGTFAMKTEQQGNKILIASETKMNTAIVAVNYYRQLKELYKKAIEHQMEKIVIEKSGTNKDAP